MSFYQQERAYHLDVQRSSAAFSGTVESSVPTGSMVRFSDNHPITDEAPAPKQKAQKTAEKKRLDTPSESDEAPTPKRKAQKTA